MPIAQVHPVVELPPRLAQVARDLARNNPFITPDHTRHEVLEIFTHDAVLQNLPVLEDGYPIGLINRSIFMTNFAMPFRREVYARKSCIAFMDKSPLIVDEELPIGELCRQASGYAGKALREGYIVTAGKRYAGVGLGNELLTAVADLQAERNRQINESIDYASVIQRSFMRPSRTQLEQFWGDDFGLVWEPRDAVGGDCFYAHRTDSGFLFLLMDCTGHGVPGALMTMIVMALADHAASKVELDQPGRLLHTINRMLKEALDQRHSRISPLDARMQGHALVEGSDDGMDAVALWVSHDRRSARFAGAHLPLLLQRQGSTELETIDGNKFGIGYIRTPDDFEWDTHTLSLAPGERLFLATDGVNDQVGGERRFAYGRRRLQAALQESATRRVDTQVAHLWQSLLSWQGSEARRDDITILGVQA